MTPIRRPGLRPFVSLILALTVLAPGLSLASLPAGKVPGPELISPPVGATVQEGGLRLAWRPAASGTRQVLLISRSPFDTRGWAALPKDPAIETHAVAKPVASLEEIGIKLTADTRFYWAAASQDVSTGRYTFSDVRSFEALRKFRSEIEPSPYLRTLPIEHVAPEVASPAADRIRLTAGYEIDPRVGEPALPAKLRNASVEGGVTRTRAYLVYFGDADPEVTRKQILESGGTVVSYVPDHTFLVRSKTSAPISLESESWVGDFQPAYKLSPRLDLETARPEVVSVLVFPDGDIDAVAATVTAGGGQIVARSDNGINKILRVSGIGAMVSSLALNADVAWIEPYLKPMLHNDNAQWVLQTFAGTVAPNNRRIWDLGLKGEGQVVMTSDSGINTTHDLFRDPAVPLLDFGDYPTHRKIIAYKLGSVNPGVAFGDHAGASYHGSHTAGTIVGNDDPIGASTRDGMAKNAKIYFMDISGTALANGVDPMPDLNDLFQPPYTGNGAGAARISSNSWGSAAAGAYDLNSLNVDQFMWNHPDFLIFFSNGNSGTVGSVGSPATAKNSVGAGGTRNGTLANQIYTSTSRGPCDDSRRKPTICSPASSLTSAGAAPSSYQSLAGTSMASPCMAGTTALMRQYLTEGWYPTGAKVPANGFNPSAALLKAMAVNSGSANVSGGGPAPDNNIGYGRMNADSVLYFAGDARRLLLVDNTDGLGHQQSISYQVNVTDGTIPFEISLCWTDYPGNPSVAIQIVNDLNLRVSNGVVTYRGNSYNAQGVSNTTVTVDSRNVEEAVLVPYPLATGVWTITIDAVNVPFGPQPFGLCITGGIGTTAGTLALDRGSYGSASTIDMRVTDTNAGSASVHLSSDTEPAGETIALTGGNGLFNGSIPLSPLRGTAGDGTLQVSSGDIVNATYNDASPVATLTAFAQISFTPPVITQVGTSNQANGVVLVSWKTDVNASSRVYYGTTASLGSSTTLDPLAATSHQVAITGLNVGQTYFYDVESQDLNGNLTRDDNGGSHYQFTVNPSGDVLLIYSATDFERPTYYTKALDRFGWTYDIWKGPFSDNPQVGNLSTGMRSYKVVWWQVGLEQYPPMSDVARTALTQYLDGGGRLGVVGNDIAWAFGANDPVNNPFYSTERRDWMQNTLHTVYVADPPAWGSVSGIAADPISGDYSGGLGYSEHRSGASGDEISFFPGAGTSVGNWLSGDGSPDNAGFRWESSGALGIPGSAVWGGARSRISSMNFEWTSVLPFNGDDDATRAAILDKALIWLTGRPHASLAVVDPNGGLTLDTDTFSIVWNESAAGGSTVGRTIQYSVDAGRSWVTLTTSAGPSPYDWDLTTVPNSDNALIRIILIDDGTPALSRIDVSDAVFAIQRANGDLVGPSVVAGSIRVNPNPVDNQQPATITAIVSDSLSGASNVTQAEFSFGDAPVPAGNGIPMNGNFGGLTANVSVTNFTGFFQTGFHRLYVRARDSAGNWGNASSVPLAVNGSSPLDVGGTPRVFELKQNAPNPMVANTTISFAVPVESKVQLVVFDVQGRQVRHLMDQTVRAGNYDVRWDRADDSGRPVVAGLYYYRLIAGNQSFERRMVALH